MVLDLRLLVPSNPLLEILIAVVLLFYVLGVLFLTRYVFSFLKKKKLEDNVIIYYNRKIIHVLAGGVVALIAPYLFSSPLIPTAFALSLAIITYIPHKTGKILYWFQVKDNMYEVNFCIAWGLALLILWLVFGNPIYAIIPISFMSFGDAVTGIIRNTVYKKRTKSWLGNLGMLLVTLPIGVYYAGYVGLVVAVIASIVEHYEIPPLMDDNVLITAASLLVLIASKTFGLL
jgi:dolichol kinase